MQSQPELGKSTIPFTELPDLAGEKLGGKVTSASDEFFAPKENLVKVAAPIFIPEKYTELGKWMDGWESRRKRGVGPGNDHDWCVIKLGVPGVIHGFNVDTSFFTGNFPEFCAIDGCCVDATAEDGPWVEIVPKTRLQGGMNNLIPVLDRSRWSYVRLRIFPDGGVARLRVYGEVRRDWDKVTQVGGLVDLAALVNGARVVACNDMFFGPKENLILPGRADTMGEGWETRRRRGPGFDWIVIALAASGKVKKIEVDTRHFKGNFPEAFRLEGCAHPARDLDAASFRDRADLAWKELFPRTPLKADHQHVFEIPDGNQKTDYLRLSIFPDGGVSRLRAWGQLG